MPKYHLLFSLMLLAALLLPTGPTHAQGRPDFRTLIEPDDVMQHVEVLAVDIGARVMGSEAELAAAEYIAEQFETYGYEVEIQEFETVSPFAEEGSDSSEITSRNVVATRAGDDQIVIVGAHMDSVPEGKGAGDNASGVAAMLAAAEALAEVETTHTLMFVAFGAEEEGLAGSTYFVEQLGDETGNVIAMINIDSVGIGTDLNVYAGARVTWPESDEGTPEIEGGPTWVRDLALDLAAEMDLPFQTSPDATWGGYTGDWSDHYPFVLADVPIAYFEAWQWDGAENHWWGQETAEGDIMHTEGDVFENVVPEKVEMTAEVLAATTAALATGAAAPPEA